MSFTHAISSASLTDLSQSIFEYKYWPAAIDAEELKADQRTYTERLASCGMIAAPDDPTPTMLGLLTLGKNPQDFIPGAYIQFLRLDGVRVADEIIDSMAAKGTLSEMLDRIKGKLESHNRIAIDVTSGATHTIHHLYPTAAMFQALYNTVLHRNYEGTNAHISVFWYDDRIEFISPGGPYGDVTEQNFGEAGLRDCRNPNISDVLKNQGFIKACGRGIPIIRNSMSENGNPEPEFAVNSSLVVCTLKKKP